MPQASRVGDVGAFMRIVLATLAVAAVGFGASAAPAAAAPECNVFQDGNYVVCMADYVYDRVEPRLPFEIPPHIPPPGS